MAGEIFEATAVRSAPDRIRPGRSSLYTRNPPSPLSSTVTVTIVRWVCIQVGSGSEWKAEHMFMFRNPDAVSIFACRCQRSTPQIGIGERVASEHRSPD